MAGRLGRGVRQIIHIDRLGPLDMGGHQNDYGHGGIAVRVPNPAKGDFSLRPIVIGEAKDETVAAVEELINYRPRVA